MTESLSNPKPGAKYWATCPRPYEEVVERAEAVDLGQHLPPESVDTLSREAKELGVDDPNAFLRQQVVRFGDIREVQGPELTEADLPDFIETVLAATRDGVYS